MVPYSHATALVCTCCECMRLCAGTSCRVESMMHEPKLTRACECDVCCVRAVHDVACTGVHTNSTHNTVAVQLFETNVPTASSLYTLRTSAGRTSMQCFRTKRFKTPWTQGVAHGRRQRFPRQDDLTRVQRSKPVDCAIKPCAEHMASIFFLVATNRTCLSWCIRVRASEYGRAGSRALFPITRDVSTALRVIRCARAQVTWCQCVQQYECVKRPQRARFFFLTSEAQAAYPTELRSRALFGVRSMDDVRVAHGHAGDLVAKSRGAPRFVHDVLERTGTIIPANAGRRGWTRWGRCHHRRRAACPRAALVGRTARWG